MLIIQLPVSKLLCTSIPLTKYETRKRVQNKANFEKLPQKGTKKNLNLQAILSPNIYCHIFIILNMTLFYLYGLLSTIVL